MRLFLLLLWLVPLVQFTWADSSSSPSLLSSSSVRPFGVIASTAEVLTRGGSVSVTRVADEQAAAPQGPVPLSQADVDEIKDEPLLKDIQLLTDILADVVKRENPKVHELYTYFRQAGLNRASDTNNAEPLDNMIQCASELSPQDALGVMKIFTLALNLVNAAETHHRLRLMRMQDFEQMLEASSVDVVGPLPQTQDSVRGTIDEILETNSATPDEIYKQLLKQKVEIVLTAHPTEVNRKTLLRKFRQITETLAYLERPDLHPYERSEAMARLKRIIAAIWGSDEIRRKKPSVQQEAAGGNAIIESVLWDAVPAYLRKLNAQCEVSLHRRLPVDVVPIQFASWIGGDRDGNPNVTPQVTREVITHQRLRAAKLFLSDLNKLYNEVAISSRFSPELEELADVLDDTYDRIEKYRRVIGHLRLRLVKTVKECEAELASLSKSGQLIATETSTYTHIAGWEEVEPIYTREELMTPLKIMHDSLVKTDFEMVADGLLVDIIRRLAVFGMTLVPLDIREESTKHTEALDAITRWLGIGSYKLWDEPTKLSFLQAELTGKRPMFRVRDLAKLGFDESVQKTLNTFIMAAEQEPEALGAYVISQAQTASDVLAVMLLQKQFGMTPDNGNMMRVVPLFETLNDLENAAGVLDQLFRMPTYAGAIRGKQEVMVGYSDSAKDAGRLAACWAQYNSQEDMVEVAKKHNIELTFFHGKGGTVGRGGNPALYRAIQSHPPHTINGRFRVTEQGEMITQNFGAPAIAERTLDIYTAAVLGEAFSEKVEPTKKWRREMARISKVSCADYRFLVREEPRFVPYFRQATPELELGFLNIGSRPAKRNPKGGIESLRAIPWTFAWTQTRTHLSAWLGVGAGLSSENEEEIETLKEMYEQWPWFTETIDLIAMILSKTDWSISKNYDDQLVDRTEELIGLGEEVRGKLVETRTAVLDVMNSTDLAKGPHVALLRASTKIRHPYVDPINVVQVELLKRLRTMDQMKKLTPEQREQKETLKDALTVSINGIAQGMRNSG